MHIIELLNWTNPSEMPNQIRFDRNNPKVQGSVFFSAKNFGENPKGVTDTLRNDLYRYIINFTNNELERCCCTKSTTEFKI